MEKSNTKKLFIISILIAFAFLSLSLFAQDKQDDLKSKLDQLKGKVEKITVKVDGKDVVFEGKDTEKLAKGLRFFAKTPHMIWLSDDDEDFDIGEGNVMMYKFNADKFDWKDKDGKTKKIKVQVENGKKKVTVTTTKDGKEETKVFEGDDAEKFLKENEKEGEFCILMNEDEDSNGSVIYFNKKADDDDCNCCCGKKIHFRGKPMHGKGIKKIIIEKTEKDNKSKEEKSKEK